MFEVFKEIYSGLFKENLYMKIGFGCILFILIFGGCHYINEKMGLKDDNELEEIVEEIINQKIGIDIDLTPASKEKKNG